MKNKEKVYTKQDIKGIPQTMTLELKSGALHKGQVMLSNGTVLFFKDGKMSVSSDMANLLLSESNDFKEVK